MSDEQIAQAAQKGDIHSFGLLVERYEAKLLRYGRKFLSGYEDGEDAVQEVFLKAYVNIQSFDAARPFSSWIYRIAHNEFINTIKKKGREPISFFDPDTMFPHPAALGEADGNLNRLELKKIIGECLNQLHPKYREPLVLYYYEDMSYRQVSEIIQIPPSTVGIRIKRGKEALREAYGKLHPSP